MYTEENIITLLSLSGKTVELIKPRDDSLKEFSDIGKFFVGYGDILSSFPNRPIALDLTHQYGENLIQAFDVSFTCSRNSVPTFWRLMFKCLNGKNPIPTESENSGLTLVASGPVSYDQKYVHWVSRWHIGFPTHETFEGLI